jgi:hypothetical protein
VILAPYDGLSDPESIELEFMPVWLQVHKIPEGYRKEKVVRQLVSRTAGEIVTVEMTPAGGFRGDFVRVRVKHDVRKPLTRFVSIVLGGKRSLFAVKYEKIGQLCFACGFIGHEYKECGTGLFDDKQLKFGEWIHAYPSVRGKGGFAIGGLRGGSTSASISGKPRGGGVVGDGFGRGRGSYVDWRDHPEHNGRGGENDFDDTATSPVKSNDVNMLDRDNFIKRRLAFEQNQGNVHALTNSGILGDIPNVVAGEDIGSKETVDNKRYKKADGSSTSGLSAGSAASLEDDRRAQ